MRRLFFIIALLVPMTMRAYSDHRGHNLDSLETVAGKYALRIASASVEEASEYTGVCRELAWGYLQIDGPKSVYYAKQAIAAAPDSLKQDTIFDMSILIGQHFWAREEMDSARVYYGMASKALEELEKSEDTASIESAQARLWGTLGNFCAVQDSMDQFVFYYGKAGVLFDKNGWWEDCSILHRNIGEVYTDAGDLKKAKPEYEKSLEYARRSGDSLMIAGSLYGLGRWHKESGHTAKALKYLAEADEYYGNHKVEEANARADTLAVMNDARKILYRNSLIIGGALFAILLLAIASLSVARSLKRTRQELSETSVVLDETIEDLRPDPSASKESEITLTERERQIAKLMVEGKNTKEISETVHLGVNTVLWYRKRLYAKLDVHSAAAFSTEIHRRGLLA